MLDVVRGTSLLTYVIKNSPTCFFFLLLLTFIENSPTCSLTFYPLIYRPSS